MRERERERQRRHRQRETQTERERETQTERERERERKREEERERERERYILLLGFILGYILVMKISCEKLVGKIVVKYSCCYNPFLNDNGGYNPPIKISN